MMDNEAPLKYVKNYYEQRLARRRIFPEATKFYLRELRHVRGQLVLNAGCGPQLYDYLRYFGELPKVYFGVDINRSTFEYMKHSRNAELLASKRFARDEYVDVRDVCNDVCDCMESLELLNCVVGVGFFGTFCEQRFRRVIDATHRRLRPLGLLVNISWYGCHLSRRVHRKKVRYRYDGLHGPSLEETVSWTERQGFQLVHRTLFDVPDKDDYGWETIQSCVFRKV